MTRPRNVRIYAEAPALRYRQRLSDALTLLWVAGWCFAGRTLYRTIEELRDAASGAESAGAGFADRLDSAARTVADLPLVGGPLRRPFSGAADAGRTLEAAGAVAGSTIHTTALWAGLLVALFPIVWILLRYLPDRLRWMREAGAAADLRLDGEDLELLALRAVATAPLHELRRATADPAGALARRDFIALANIEMRRLGLRTRA